jgi:hypothetical protein
MQQSKVRQLARLVEIQRLRKAGHETRLATLQMQIAGIDEERAALEELQNRHYEGSGSFIPLNTIVTRLDTILRRRDELEAEAEREKRALLEASRMLDRADEKHVAERRSLERAEGAKALEEALPHLIARARSSLP